MSTRPKETSKGTNGAARNSWVGVDLIRLARRLLSGRLVSVAGCRLRGPSIPPDEPVPASGTDVSRTTNSIGMELVLAPAGEFLMGGSESPEELTAAIGFADVFADQYPQHPVRITRAFYMGAHEVTVGEFRRFVEDTHYTTDAERPDRENWGVNMEKHEEEMKHEYNWRKPWIPADGRPPGSPCQLVRRGSFLSMAQPQGRPKVPLADGGRMGIRSPPVRRHDSGVEMTPHPSPRRRMSATEC